MVRSLPAVSVPIVASVLLAKGFRVRYRLQGGSGLCQKVLQFYYREWKNPVVYRLEARVGIEPTLLQGGW